MSGKVILYSLIFGVIVSTIICLIIGAKHKPVKIAKNANQYLDKNSVNITGRYDHFVRHTVDKTPINK